jgi:hypothetical protein
MRGYLLSMKVLVAAALALAFALPAAAAAPRLSPADRAAISRSIDVFVNHAVTRANPGGAYDVVAPEMRPGIGPKEWARGDIPVYPFPARGQHHPWNVLYVTREEVGLELELIPRRHSKVGPIIFHIYLRPVRGGRWLVDSFMPVATLAPLNAKKSKVLSVRDFSPQISGGASLDATGPSRLNSIYLIGPFAALGLVLLGLAAWGVARAVRSRRLQGPRSSEMPPLPPGRVTTSRRA